MLAVICSLFAYPDHLCFDRTIYDNINGSGGPFMFDIIGPAGPLVYPDQIFRDRPYTINLICNNNKGTSQLLKEVKWRNY